MEVAGYQLASCHAGIFWQLATGNWKLRCGRFGFVRKLRKRRGLTRREFREALAIELDAGVLEAEHELAVGDAVLARRGVDADDPQAAVIALLELAAGVRVDARFFGRLFHELVKLALVLEIALGELRELLALLTTDDTTFDARHD